MSDMPDFDSMSPEEMMRWMESLAKRQGATEGLTTSADMEVAQVSADDDRLKGVGDYVPYGWTAEKWQEHLAKEEAAKASKQPAAPEPTPPAPVAAPVPEPQPVAQPVAQSAPETPDFDSMSPEEMMRWMESLAKRSGATEGFTTSADMDVAQVSADDERLKDVGEYVPYGWTAEKWQEHLAKEEAAKASKQTAAAPKPATPPAEEADELAAALSGNVLQAPSFDDLFAGNNIIAGDDDELEYADDEEVYQYVDEEEAIAYADDDEFIEYRDDSEPVAVQSPMDWLSGLSAQEPELSIDDEDEEDEEPVAVRNPMDWLAGLGAEEPQLDFDADEIEEEPEPAQAVANDPMGWLSGLTGQEAEIDLSLDIDALSSLESLGSVEASGDSMDWLAGLASGTGDALAGLGNLATEDEIEEGSLEWMESLARRQGAYTEELTTGGYRDIPQPAEIEDDGPGYEPFSFETGTGAVQADSDTLTPMPSLDVDQLDMDDPGSWLDHLASGVSGTRPDDSDMFMGEEDLPELYEEDYEEITEDVMNRINTGRDVSPEEMQAFFEAQFRKAEQMPEEDDIEEDELAGPLEAQIPDWLRESMSTAPEAAAPTPSRTDTAEMMIENLGLDEEIEVPEELPEWLAGGMEADTGDIVEDIFASSEESEEMVAIEEVMVGPLDTSDTWVQAFVQESTGEMEDWYKEKVAHLDGEPVSHSAEEPVAAPIPVAAVAAAVSGALEHIELPVETRLQAGEAQVLPAWMGGVTAKQETEVAVIEQHEITDEVVALDWLSGDDHEFAEEDGMPDWLRDTVDDSLAPREDLPDWLAGEDIGMIATDEIPDWLRETLDEEEELVDASIFGVAQEPAPEPVQQAPKPVPVPVPAPAPAPVTVPVPVQKSPAPVPVRAASIDVAATLQAAQQKVSSGDLDGGLAEYEAVVRANAALDQVEQAVRKLADDKNQKGNPAVFRVLGDTLMRKGNLQEALDTYRKALNML